MTLPFAPRTEIIWSQKDEFQAWAFFRSSIRFVRDQSGAIASLELHYGVGNNIIRGKTKQPPQKDVSGNYIATVLTNQRIIINFIGH